MKSPLSIMAGCLVWAIIAACLMDCHAQDLMPPPQTNWLMLAKMNALRMRATNNPAPITGMLFSWEPGTNGFLVVDTCTNLALPCWHRYATLYPIWPSNTTITINPADPPAYFRVGIIAPVQLTVPIIIGIPTTNAGTTNSP